jgi:hypothetical protein
MTNLQGLHPCTGETNCKGINETSIISFETTSSDIAGSEVLKERNVESRKEV